MDSAGKKRFKIREFFPGWNLIEYAVLRSFAGAINFLPIAASSRIASVIGDELRANHLVAILIDQWAGDEGLRGRFFGEETSTTSIPVRLSMKTGCALIPAYCIRTGSGRYKISIMPEVAIQGETENDWEAQTTDALNRLLEEQILRYPEQWIWTHRRWKGYNAYHGKAKS